MMHNRYCEPGAFNVAGTTGMVWFRALRDGIWRPADSSRCPREEVVQP